MSVLYILNEAGQPVRCKDLATWAMFMADKERRMVDHCQVGGFFVSTAFIGITASYTDDGQPQLWETLVRRVTRDGAALYLEADGTITRCSGTREQAEAQHRQIVTDLWTKEVWKKHGPK